MATINSNILPFSTEAFYRGEFVNVTQEHLEGKWAVFCLLYTSPSPRD